MPQAAVKRRPALSTRVRILEAAILRFSQYSYEETKLRDIAADVGVDVAFVHRSFGSKEQLFREAFKAAVTVLSERLLAAEEKDIVNVLTEDIFERGPVALRMFVCSLSSEQAREVLRNVGLRNFIGPLASKLPYPAPQRAALIAACLAGIRVLRDVLRLDPLLDGSKVQLQPLVEAIFRVCLNEQLKTDPSMARVASAEPAKRKRHSASNGRGILEVRGRLGKRGRSTNDNSD